MPRKDTIRPKLKRFTVAGQYRNAHDFKEIDIKGGDTCVVKVGAPIKPGDIVLFTCPHNCTNDPTTPHYHAQYFYRVNGKKWDFRLNTTDQNGGTFYKDDSLSIIVGPVVRAIGKSAPRTERRDNHAGFLTGTLTEAWPGERLKIGDRIKIQPGPVEIGDIIFLQVKREGQSRNYISRLVSRDGVGNIVVRGSTGRRIKLKKDGYTIKGKYVGKSPKWPETPPSPPQESHVAPALTVYQLELKGKLDDLRERYENLDDEDDYNTPDQRRRLERRIQECEREIERDNWPEVIGDEN